MMDQKSGGVYHIFNGLPLELETIFVGEKFRIIGYFQEVKMGCFNFISLLKDCEYAIRNKSSNPLELILWLSGFKKLTIFKALFVS